MKAFISGCRAESLNDDERHFFANEQPWGLILFGRNCVSPSQLSELTADFRASVGRENAPVLIDQEGGRVQRLRPPHWRSYPAGQRFAELHALNPNFGQRAAYLTARLIASDLQPLGINVDCLPVLDVAPSPETTVIGDRALGLDPDIVSILGQSVIDGLDAGGVLPVMKHIPGHGRGRVDSHVSLPVVDDIIEVLDSTDFAPFRALKHVSMAMSAHIVFSQLDRKAPATQSEYVINHVIRGLIGFGGLLMSDDLSMQALQGEMRERTAACFAAGCDMVLHCNGDFGEMRAVASMSPQLEGEALARAQDALGHLKAPQAFDADAGFEELQSLLSQLS